VPDGPKASRRLRSITGGVADNVTDGSIAPQARKRLADGMANDTTERAVAS
jgi:hypothetical protein